MFYRMLGHVLVCGFAKKELAASEEQPQCTFHESAEGLRPLAAYNSGLAVNDDHETAVIVYEGIDPYRNEQVLVGNIRK